MIDAEKFLADCNKLVNLTKELIERTDIPFEEKGEIIDDNLKLLEEIAAECERIINEQEKNESSQTSE